MQTEKTETKILITTTNTMSSSSISMAMTFAVSISNAICIIMTDILIASFYCYENYCFCHCALSTAVRALIIASHC